MGYTGTWAALLEFLDRWASVGHAADDEIAVRYRVETGQMRHVSIRMTSREWTDWVAMAGGFETATNDLRVILLDLHSDERTVFYENYGVSPPADLYSREPGTD